MFKNSMKILCILLTIISVGYSQWENPCYSSDDPLNDDGMNYSGYQSSEPRLITVRGHEYKHSDSVYRVTTTEWTNLRANLNSLFSDFGIQFEFESLSQVPTSTEVNNYIADGTDPMECSSSFIYWIFNNVTAYSYPTAEKYLDIIFIPFQFDFIDNGYTEYYDGIIDKEFRSTIIYNCYENIGDSGSEVYVAYYICAALGLYDVQSDIEGNGDYVDDTTEDDENLMNRWDISDELTDGQTGRLHWALTNHNNLKPLIQETAIFKNLVNNQSSGTVKLDASSPEDSPYSTPLLDGDSHTIETTDRQITDGNDLHQLAHWEDESNDVRSLKFHQSETFNFNKKNPDWYGRFNLTYNFSTSTNPSGLDVDILLEDPWENEGVFFKPTSSHPVFNLYNSSFDTDMENYQIKAPEYCATMSHIYKFDGWTCDPVGDAIFENSSSIITKVDFQDDGVEIIAHYVSANANGESVTISSGETLSLPAGGSYDIANNYFEMYVYGALEIQGASANKISFQLSGSATSWGGINVESGGKLKIKHAEFDYAQPPITVEDGADSVTVYNAVFSNFPGSGIIAYNPVHVEKSLFYGGGELLTRRIITV